MTGDEALVVATEALRNIVRLDGITAELIARKALAIIGGESDAEAEDKFVAEILARGTESANMLNPCPFCGSANVEVDRRTDDAYSISCNFCHATGPEIEITCYDKTIPPHQLAADAWNKCLRPNCSHDDGEAHGFQ
jgi:hypothetical protein